MEYGKIKAVQLKHPAGESLSSVEAFGPDCAKKVRGFHRSFPEYSETPLAELGKLAEKLGVSSIHVKD